jgi:hypothetical protein
MVHARLNTWVLFSVVAPVAMVVACGCASGGKQPSALRVETTTIKFRSLAAGAADNYATAVAQATDQLRRTTTRPEVTDWAWQTKIATAMASFTNATGPNDATCLLDMVLLATLKRCALEEHWIPELLHEEGRQVLEIYRRAEADVWEAAAQGLTREQLAELHALIDRWRLEHPGQYYVSHVRFADMASAMKVDAASPEARSPGSVFGLLHLDPLAGLDPVTQELRNYRALSERMIYMSVRMPLVLGWQVEYVATRVTATPEVQRIAGSTEQFVKVLDKYPSELSKERQAALIQVQTLAAAERQATVDQVARAVAVEREAIARELTTQQSSVRQIIADVQRVVETTARATENANTETSKTIARTEEAGRRSMVLGFQLVLAVIVVLIVGTPAVLLLYRLANKRWIIVTANPPPPTHPVLRGSDKPDHPSASGDRLSIT